MLVIASFLPRSLLPYIPVLENAPPRPKPTVVLLVWVSGFGAHGFLFSTNSLGKLRERKTLSEDSSLSFAQLVEPLVFFALSLLSLPEYKLLICCCGCFVA